MFSFIERLMGADSYSKVLEVRRILAQAGGHISAFSGAPDDRKRAWLARQAVEGMRARHEDSLSGELTHATHGGDPGCVRPWQSRRACGRWGHPARGCTSARPSSLWPSLACAAGAAWRGTLRGGGLMARVPDEGAGLARERRDR